MRLDADLGIVRVTFLPETAVTLEMAREEIALIKRLTGGRRLPALIDFTNIISTTLSARVYYAGQETRSAFSVAAFLTKAPMEKAIANVFLAFHGRLLGSRIRMFTSESEALDWLRQFVRPAASGAER